MSKPKFANLFDKQVGPDAERVLVTLSRHLGPWRGAFVLVGGLTPAYLVRRRPPDVPAHAGTGDLDLVVDLEVLTDTEAYWSLEENLEDIGFQRITGENGQPSNWRWRFNLGGGRSLILEFLADYPDADGEKVLPLPAGGKVSAAHIPHSSIVFDLHDQIQITADLLPNGGRAMETIFYANIVSFTCLKAFAFDHRAERKDAHDLVYCLEHVDGGVEHAIQAFAIALEGPHRSVILDALELLRARFAPDPDEGYLYDGPVAVALFELGEDEADRNARLLRQRQANAIVEQLLNGLDLLKALEAQV